MLNQSQLQFETEANTNVAATRLTKNPLSKFDLLGVARRQLWILVACTGIAAVLGILYAMQAIPTYTSSVSILIDAKKVGMTATNQLEGSLTFEAGAVDSQLQILLSDKLASNVAQRLGLQDNLAFLEPSESSVSKVLKVVLTQAKSAYQAITNTTAAPSIKNLPENIRLLIATTALQNNTKIQRVGRTYVFTLDYNDPDPVLAQSIAGQFANAYLEDQLDSKFDSTKRATNWMEERIRELRSRSLSADEAVQKYRAANNLFAVSGRLMDEQSLTDATTQLTSAKTRLDTASARYQRLRQIIDTQDLTGSLTEALSNPNVASLRSRYLDSAKQASEISSRYGETHQAAVKARKDMEEYTRLIFEELKNLLPGYQSDVAIAQAQVASIQNTIDQLRQASTANDSAMVKLRALEQESDTLKTLYSTFLQKSQELQQQQSFPVTDARIISDASTPLLPTGPKKPLIVLASLFLGAIVGACIALVREWRDRGFRTAVQIRDELGLEFIANVPALGKHLSETDTAPNTTSLSALFEESSQTLRTKNPLLVKVIAEPFSQFSEAIRALRSKVTSGYPRKKGVVIGLISMFPDEGKSTIAKNLASSLALQGASTILIDGDFRNPSLTHSLFENAKAGVIDVLNGEFPISDVLAFEKESGLVFMPGAMRRRQTNDIFGSKRIRELVEQLRDRFEFIFIDFPPVGALTDAIAADEIVDGYFFVVQWGKTPRSVVREFLDNNVQIADKTLGVVLNKVDLKKLGSYGAYQGSSAYSKYAEKYFSNSGTS